LSGGALVPVATGILQPSAAIDIKKNVQVKFQKFSDVCQAPTKAWISPQK